MMKTTLKFLFGSVALAALFTRVQTLSAGAATAQGETMPRVQIALLLDTSGSMSGLIEQAKGQLWKIVNEFVNARQNGQRPELQVALYEYGKTSLPSQSGWIRQIQPLTTDLDKISEELFALTTNGGEEYCGWVIRDALRDLAWSEATADYKAIFIAGNEPFTQGPVAYAQSCRAAIAKGIIVNTIHCGEEGTGIQTQWQDGALLADGKYMFINHNQAVVHFQAPQDQEITRLGVELNQTYLAYGVAGLESQLRQTAQDTAAATLAPQGAALNRALAKASANYHNAHWDLVDAVRENKVILNELKSEELPAEMQKMTQAQRKATVETKAKERAEIQAKIQKLNAERAQYVAEQAQKQGVTNTLDAVMINAIREQAQKRNFEF